MPDAAVDLKRELRVRLEECTQLLGQLFDLVFPSQALLESLLPVLLELLCLNSITFRLPRLREQDQRRCVRRLGGERQIQQDERIRVPMADKRYRVQENPDNDCERLRDDVLRRPEEARGGLGGPSEAITPEWSVVIGHGRTYVVRDGSPPSAPPLQLLGCRLFGRCGYRPA